MPYTHTNPVKITETKYFNSGTTTSNTVLTYDSKNRLSEKVTDGIDGRKYFTKYKYADDIVPLQIYNTSSLPGGGITAFTGTGFAGGFKQIQLQGWFGRPVEVVSGYYENGNTYYTSGTISLFNKPGSQQGNFYQLSATKPSYYLSHPLPYVPKCTAPFATLSQEWVLTLDEPATNYQFMQNNGGNIVFDQNYIKVADYEYNDKLRLTRIKPANALETTYVWDNNNLYPVSETTGNFTTKYFYKSFVGLIDSTDPRGVVSHTTYDIFNRPLQQFLYKGENNVSAKTTYLYHYNNQQ